MLSIPKFNKIKSDCRICIGSIMCDEHQKLWDNLLLDIKNEKL